MFIACTTCRSVSDKHLRHSGSGYETRDKSRHTRVLTIDGLLFLRMIVMTDDDDKVNMDDMVRICYRYQFLGPVL